MRNVLWGSVLFGSGYKDYFNPAYSLDQKTEQWIKECAEPLIDLIDNELADGIHLRRLAESLTKIADLAEEAQGALKQLRILRQNAGKTA